MRVLLQATTRHVDGGLCSSLASPFLFVSSSCPCHKSCARPLIGLGDGVWQQFGYLYTFHPKTCSKEEIAGLVDEVMTRHRRDAEDVWAKTGLMSQADIDKEEGRKGAGLAFRAE